MAQWKQIQLGTMRLRVRPLASLSGLRIWRCHKLWCRSKTRLGSCTAVVQASSCSFPSLGTSKYCRSGPKKPKKKRRETNWVPLHLSTS